MCRFAGIESRICAQQLFSKSHANTFERDGLGHSNSPRSARKHGHEGEAEVFWTQTSTERPRNHLANHKQMIQRNILLCRRYPQVLTGNAPSIKLTLRVWTKLYFWKAELLTKVRASVCSLFAGTRDADARRHQCVGKSFPRLPGAHETLPVSPLKSRSSDA